jgi:hypothetical protein
MTRWVKPTRPPAGAIGEALHWTKVRTAHGGANPAFHSARDAGHADDARVRPLELEAICTMIPPRVKFQSGPDARHGDGWPAAFGQPLTFICSIRTAAPSLVLSSTKPR